MHRAISWTDIHPEVGLAVERERLRCALGEKAMSDKGVGVGVGVGSHPENPESLPISPPLDRDAVDAELREMLGGPGGDVEAPQGDARSFRMRRLMAFTDIAALCLAWVLTGAALDWLGRATATTEEFLLFVAFLPVWVIGGSLNGLYHESDRRVDPSIADEIGRLLVMVTAWTWAYLLVRGAVTSGPNQLLPAIGLWGTVLVSMVLLRPIARHCAQSRDWFWENVLVVGQEEDVDRVWRRLSRHPEYGLRAVDAPGIWEELDSRAGIDRLIGIVREKRIARVLVATTLHSVEGRGRLVRRLREAGVQTDLATGAADSYAPSVILNYLEGLPVMSVPVIQRSKAMRVVKRLFDLVGACSALIVLSPLLVYCAVRIKFDSKGPVFFRQERIGKNDTPFKVFKFRSMVIDADQRKAEVEALNMHADQDDGLMFKIREDPRITRFGGWLRRWSLDELPQLLNVVRGEMSLVGPRPLIPEEARLISEHYKARFKVLPGVTGAWQAHGRSDIGFEDMVQLDYMYVANWSFSEDLKLILRTIELIMHGRGAY